MKTIVTAEAKGADIDVFACAVAYAELLSLEGKESIPVIPGMFTASVTPSILAWGAKYETIYSSDGSENFVLVDISDPDQFPSFVFHNRISEIYDHRSGHETYWKDRIQNNAHIEMVGACGTLIWEQFKKRAKEKDISMVSAKLLLASIVSNTLAFRSLNVTERDKVAYAELSAITGLSEEWIQKYFLEQEDILLKNFEQYLRADTKVFKTASGDFAIGQIEIWDATDLLNTRKNELDHIMSEYESMPWIVNIPNISKGFNYVYSKSLRGKEIIEKVCGLKFENDIATTKGLLMRKYLMKVLREV